MGCLEKRNTNSLIIHAAPQAIEIKIVPLNSILSCIGAIKDNLIKYPKVPGNPAMHASAINKYVACILFFRPKPEISSQVCQCCPIGSMYAKAPNRTNNDKVKNEKIAIKNTNLGNSSEAPKIKDKQKTGPVLLAI
ncbi:MAG: hypothetical protein BWZ03_00431 [bacterium ADurb.BinA186]|nr:MAG: hypothetical protein BWZ03_00431 [bacterium ADurb.BinA186]